MRLNPLQIVLLTSLAFAAIWAASPPPVNAQATSEDPAEAVGDPSAEAVGDPFAEAVGETLAEAVGETLEEAAGEVLAEAAFEFARAKLYADSGEFEAALTGFERSLELDSSDPYSLIEISEFHAYLAQISRSQRRQLDHLQSAAEYADRALAVATDNLDVLRSYAQTHLRLVEQQQVESIHEARGAFENLRSRTTGDLHVLLSLGRIYLWQGEAGQAVEVLREAESFQPNHPTIEGLLAEALLGAGEKGDAEELLVRLLERQPEEIELRLQLAELVSERGDHGGAVAVLRGGLQSHFSNLQLRRLLARELHLHGDNEEALQVVDTLLEEFPNRQGLQRLRVAILSALARFDDAIDLLTPMVDDGAGEDSLQDELYLCRLLERGGRAEEAADKLRALLADVSDAERVLQVKVALVGLLDRQDRGDEAVALLEEEFTQAPAGRKVAIGSMLSQFLVRYERLPEALAVLDQILAEAADAAAGDRIRLQQIAILSRQEEWQKVLAATAELMASESREVRSAVVLQRAEALAGLGEVDEALSALEQGEKDLQAMPLLAERVELLFANDRQEEAEAALAEVTASGRPQDLFFAAQVHQRGGRYLQAIPLLDRLVEEDPSASQALFFLGAAFERSGQIPQAVEAFQRLIESSPNHAAALNYLGYMWAERGENLDEALSLIRRAIAVEPDNGAYVDSLGWVYFQLGRYQEARHHLEWAARLVPDDATILEHLGDLYVVLQDLERARNSYQQALDLGTGDGIEELRRKLRDLEQKGL